MGKLMLIAVIADNGVIYPIDTPVSGIAPLQPKVVGCVDSSEYDQWVADRLADGSAERVRRAGDVNEPYQGGLPYQSATLLHTHNSPGCTWVIINGWPFCYS